jgi:hypothetical protein
MARDCPDAPPMKCKECESTEHLVKECPNRVCKNCGETGMAPGWIICVVFEVADPMIYRPHHQPVQEPAQD